MATPFIFPALPGLGWSFHKKPTFSTRVASHVSGREVRAPLYSQGLYEFEATVEGLDSGTAYPGLAANSLQSLMGLYIQCQGKFGTFLYVDPIDNTEIGQVLGAGDGITTAFTLQRNANYALEPVSWTVGVLQALLNGVAVPQYKLAEDGTTGTHFASQTASTSYPAGTPVTLTCYIKAAERTACAFLINDGAATRECDFNLSAVTATPGTGIATSSIKAVGNGWYLLSASVVLAIPFVPVFSIHIANPAGTISYAGSAWNGIYLSSPGYIAGNYSTAFLTSLVASGGTLYGPNWTITEPNTLTLAQAPFTTPTTVYKLAETAVNGQHFMMQSVASQAAGTPITFLIYINAGVDTACLMQIATGSSNPYIDIDLTTQAITNNGATAFSIVSVGGGWFRVSISTIMPALGTPSFILYTERPYLTNSYLGVVGNGILFAGASWQIDSGSPIPLPAFSTVTNATVATNAAAAPIVSTTVSADFSYAFNCRFLDDQMDFDEIMNGLWQVQSVKFKSVKP